MTMPLHQYVRLCAEQYFDALGDEDPQEVYELFLAQLEKPLIEATLHRTRGNQSYAAKILGINRGTLRSKMQRYHLD